MDALYSSLLEKTRLPQPSFQRFAVATIFRRLDSSHGALIRDAISQCLRSASAPVVDQAVREICRLVSSRDLLPISVALIELQSALDGCDPRFAPVLVKGIGFLCRFAFRIHLPLSLAVSFSVFSPVSSGIRSIPFQRISVQSRLWYIDPTQRQTKEIDIRRSIFSSDKEERMKKIDPQAVVYCKKSHLVPCIFFLLQRELLRLMCPS